MNIETGALSDNITIAIVMILTLVAPLYVANLPSRITLIPYKTSVNFSQSNNSFC